MELLEACTWLMNLINIAFQKKSGRELKFPFYDITNLIYATSYSTSNLYFLQVRKVQCLLMKNVKDEDALIRNMAKLMIVKFEKY